MALLVIGGLSLSIASHAQVGRRVTKTKDDFPYAFENFVWWHDAELRLALRKHLPTLGDEVKRGSPIEARVRLVLAQLLKEKGVQGEVQVIEPSMDVLFRKRAPEASPPSTIYSVLSPPEILVVTRTFEDVPSDGFGPLNEAAAGMKGKPYREMAIWADRERCKKVAAAWIIVFDGDAGSWNA